MNACRFCRICRVEPLLDLGPQALSNRFLTNPGDDEAAFDFGLGQCRSCGMIQLTAPVAPADLKPRVDWITYREAEGHLDELVDEVRRLPGVTTTSVVGAVSSKDDSTVARFQRLGFSRTWRISIEEDLGTDGRGAGLETVQLHLTPEKARAIAHRRGPADVLIARHVVEHALDSALFVSALRRLVRPDGYIVLEVPDCEPALQRMDYTMPWEEHVLYFTPELMKRAVLIWGLTPVSFRLYPYSHENSLVAIVRSALATPADPTNPAGVQSILELGGRYAECLPEHRRRTDSALAKFRGEKGPIAVFGAGHLSCAWINFLQLARQIDFVVDDDCHKRGLYMPGSHLPIFTSSELSRRRVQLCLLSVGKESELKVIANNRSFVDQGGRFASIFPQRPSTFVG